MANLDDKQQDLLSKLEDVRVAYDAFEKDLMAEVLDRKWAAKADMRRLVREARAAGVPFRQIGFALQTSDHNTLKDLENNRRRK